MFDVADRRRESGMQQMMFNFYNIDGITLVSYDKITEMLKNSAVFSMKSIETVYVIKYFVRRNYENCIH